MENSEILALTFKLKDKLVNSDLYRKLKEAERKMLEDSECSRLLCLYQSKQSDYNEAKRFEKYGSDVSKVSKELSNLKVEVENNKLVKEYNESYKLFSKELKKIEEIVFKDIVSKKKEITIE